MSVTNMSSVLLLLLVQLVDRLDSVCVDRSLTEAEQAVLDKHNEYRRLHLVRSKYNALYDRITPDLCYAESGDDITFSSQEYAEYLAKVGDFYHSDPTDYGNTDYDPYGENLGYMVRNKPQPGAKEGYLKMTQAWYNEIKHWDFTTNSRKNEYWNKQIGHFLQLVWRNTRQINCGYAEGTRYDGRPTYYVACQYYPIGGYEDEYAEMVLPLNSKCIKPSIAGGKILGFRAKEEGEMWTLNCYNGYEIEGDDVITCQTGNQLSTLPTCIAQECDIKGQERVECGSACPVTCADPTPVCHLACVPGQCVCPADLPVLHEGSCINLEECPEEEVMCNRPLISGGHVVPEDETILPGASYTATCTEGRVLSGNREITCYTGGSLSTLPTCSVMCDKPEIEGGVFSPEKESILAGANYTLRCSKG